jgi:cobalamin biosynthesis protein CobC
MTLHPDYNGEHKFTIHGGRLHAARLRFPDAPLPWMDLSTGINPNPYPFDHSTIDHRPLPDPASLHTLLAAAAARFGLSHSSFLAAVPGSESGLRALAYLLGKHRVALAEPTYDSHRQAWTSAGAQIIPFDQAVLECPEADIVIIVNPNNPTGVRHARENLLALAARQYQSGGYLIIDEAFADSIDSISLADCVSDEGPGSALILLRSFGKFYGLAGLRLGFVAAASPLIQRLHHFFGDWPICSGAIAAGLAAYQDHGWQQMMRNSLAARAEQLDRLLNQAGMNVIGGTPLFRLVQTGQASQIFTHLAGHGILTRPFSSHPDWLRFGLPQDHDFSRLEHALRTTS